MRGEGSRLDTASAKLDIFSVFTDDHPQFHSWYFFHAAIPASLIHGLLG
jgi:hypothetical protein